MSQMSLDLSVTHGRASGLPDLRQQITIGSFTGPCTRGPPPGRQLCLPAWFPGAHIAHRRGSDPHRPSWQMASRRHQGLLWPGLLHLTGTKILSNLTSPVPQQMQRRGPLLLFGRGTEAAMPRFQSVGDEGHIRTSEVD